MSISMLRKLKVRLSTIEVPPPYTILDNTLPKYEEIFNESKEIIVKKEFQLIKETVNEVIKNIKPGSYMRLDCTTLSPVDIIEYFITTGRDSCKDVYLLKVLNNKGGILFNNSKQKSGYYICNRKLNVTAESWPQLSSIEDIHSFRIINIKDDNNPWASSVNINALSSVEQYKILDYLRKK